MPQRQFTIAQSGDKINDVVVGSNSDNLSGGIARLIVADTATKSEVIKRVQTLLDALVKTSFPF